MAETDDRIDQTHWLPEKAPVILPERRGSVVGVDGERGGRQYHSLDKPMEFYVAKGHITGRQYRAGKRLHALWESSAKAPYVQVQYRDQEGGAKQNSFVPAGFGAAVYREALYSVEDEVARRVVFQVCCEEHFARECMPGMVRATARRHGMAKLREALHILANHFKYD